MPVVNNVDPSSVTLRKPLSNDLQQALHDFKPSAARPLFEDSTLYDFDANLKEMMGKCCEAVRKYFRKALSVNEFHKVVAKLLHIYILPSINFSPEDMYSLTRARCLIEERLRKAEQNIAEKADSMVQLRECYNTLKRNMLSRENFESERYLRTCKKVFLEAFLKAIEEDVDKVNFNLEAEQSRVNWAKQHSEDAARVQELQSKRNELFKEVDKLIQVREALKNVLKRKQLTKKKMKKSFLIDSCFHNVFVEINRRLEVEYQALNALGNNKVSICAAREATIHAIFELDNNNRSSDRSTKFEPDDFVDYLISTNNQQKNRDVWLTFQERVSQVLEDSSSQAFELHRDGCRNLTACISLSLNEFELATNWNNQLIRNNSLNCVCLTQSLPERSEELNERSDSEIDHEFSWNKKVLSVPYISFDGLNSQVDNMCNDHAGKLPLCESLPMKPTGTSLTEDKHPIDIGEEYCDDFVVLRHPTKKLRLQRNTASHQLALSALLSSVESLKLAVQDQFRNVIENLNQQLGPGESEESSAVDPHEQLWRAYERPFCKIMMPLLLQLYHTALAPGVRKAHATIMKTPLKEILKEDKLLDLLFGHDAEKSQPLSIPARHQSSEDKISLAKTLSALSVDMRHCGLDDLYDLANADSQDLQRHFQLGDMEESDETDGAKASSSGSSADLSCDDETANRSLGSSPLDSQFVCPDLPDKWNELQYSPERVEKILNPVLSPFRKFIRKSLDAATFLDKIRYVATAIENLNKTISQLMGPEFLAACDDIISMVILALSNMSEDVFVELYVNLRLLMDLLPFFLNGTLFDFNLVSLCASYDYLFTLKVCESVVRCYPGSFKVKAGSDGER